LTALNADATLAALGFNATFDAVTNKVNFTSTTTIKYLNEASGNKMARTLGILTDSIGEVLSYGATGFVDLSGVQEVYIRSSKIADGSNMVNVDSLTSPIIAHIPITVPFGAWQHYLSEHPEIDDIEYPSLRLGNTLRKADIQVCDKYGNILDLGGLDITLIMKIYHDTP
jgi:hypothetical protein